MIDQKESEEPPDAEKSMSKYRTTQKTGRKKSHKVKQINAKWGICTRRIGNELNQVHLDDKLSRRFIIFI
jgi:hypothetical protein